MKLTWLVDKQIVKNTASEDIDQVIKRLGYNVELMEYIPFMHGHDVNPTNECNIFYGTINLARLVKGKVSGLFLNEDNLRYHVYHSNLNIDKKWFLNSCFMTPFSQLPELYELLAGTVKDNVPVFIRPDSPVKLFTGMVVTSMKDLKDNMYYFEHMHKVDPHNLIIMSHAQNIEEEYRTIICGDEVIAWSRYNVKGKQKQDLQVPEEALELARMVAKSDWKPDEIFTCDIAKMREGNFSIIELNSFSCAGWYACDQEAIISKVSEYMINKMEHERDLEL